MWAAYSFTGVGDPSEAGTRPQDSLKTGDLRGLQRCSLHIAELWSLCWSPLKRFSSKAERLFTSHVSSLLWQSSYNPRKVSHFFSISHMKDFISFSSIYSSPSPDISNTSPSKSPNKFSHFIQIFSYPSTTTINHNFFNNHYTNVKPFHEVVKFWLIHIVPALSSLQTTYSAIICKIF